MVQLVETEDVLQSFSVRLSEAEVLANWLDLGRSPECIGGDTGRERWSVRVRALLSKRPLDLKEVAAKYVSLSFLSECKDLIFFTLLSTNTYGKLF